MHNVRRACSFADFIIDQTIFDSLVLRMKESIKAIAHTPADVGTQEVVDFYVEMYHKQVADCVKQRWSTHKTVQPKDVVSILRWVEKYRRLVRPP